MLVTAYPHDMIVRQNDGEGDCRLRLGKINSPYDGEAIAQLPDLIAELKRCYRIIDILQDSEDFDTQVAFHKEGLCKYLKYPCGPCETSEEE